MLIASLKDERTFEEPDSAPALAYRIRVRLDTEPISRARYVLSAISREV